MQYAVSCPTGSLIDLFHSKNNPIRILLEMTSTCWCSQREDILKVTNLSGFRPFLVRMNFNHTIPREDNLRTELSLIR